MSNEDDIKPVTFEEELIAVDKLTQENDTLKQKLVSLAMGMLDGMDMTSQEVLASRSAIEARSMMLKTALDLLEARENTAMKKATLKARAKEQDSNEKASATMVDLLRNTPLSADKLHLVPAIVGNTPKVRLTQEEQAAINPGTLLPLTE